MRIRVTASQGTVVGCRKSATDHLFLVGILLIWSVALRAAPQDSESPTEAVRGTASRVRSILEDPGKLMPRRRMLKEMLAGRFNYAEMSKRALAAYWTPLAETQRGEFVELFKIVFPTGTPKNSKVIAKNRYSTSLSN